MLSLPFIGVGHRERTAVFLSIMPKNKRPTIMADLIQTGGLRFTDPHSNENGLSGNNSTLQTMSASRNEVKLISTSNFLGREINVYGSVENPLFKAKDVAEWIEHTNPSKMVSDAELSKDDCVTVTLSTLTNSYSALMLTEDGLYEVLFQSRKPIAKQFKKGVKEILKSIRKTGQYSTKQHNLPQTYLEALKALVVAEEEKQQLALENEMNRPKVVYFDNLVSRNLLTNLRDTAKQIHIPQNKFISLLIDNKYLYRDAKEKLKPYSQYVPMYFELKDFEKNGHAGTQLLVTPKGKETFRLMLGGVGYEN